MDPILAAELISIDVTVIILCGILLKFMIKPYQATGENRYLGLPLGFGVLGLTYFIGIISVIGFLIFLLIRITAEEITAINKKI